MDYELIGIIVFAVLLSLFLVSKRKKLAIDKIAFPLLYFIMYRTKFGLKSMDKFANRFRKPLNFVFYAGVFIGFLGMIFLAYSIITELIKLFITPTTAPGVALVLPIKAKGIFYVPFFYWIISIFILAIVHEFSHGVAARLHNIKLKSSGFAFLCVLIPIIPAAFVEPNEKKIKKLSAMKQLSIYAAGPLANILLAFAILGIFLLLLVPVTNNFVQATGSEIVGITENSPAAKAGILAGETVISADNQSTLYLENFSKILESKNPNDTLIITTDNNIYTVILGSDAKNSSKPYIGLLAEQKSEIKHKVLPFFLPEIIVWLIGLLYWLYLLNLGIGVFNLIPIGPIDGGRMLLTVLKEKFEEKRAMKIFSTISLFFIALLLISFMFGFF